jgi:hypothetical protein
MYLEHLRTLLGISASLRHRVPNSLAPPASCQPRRQRPPGSKTEGNLRALWLSRPQDQSVLRSRSSADQPAARRHLVEGPSRSKDQFVGGDVPLSRDCGAPLVPWLSRAVSRTDLCEGGRSVSRQSARTPRIRSESAPASIPVPGGRKERTNDRPRKLRP